MANMETLNDEVLEAANGGAAKINTTRWQDGHWQPGNRHMGTTWTEHGYTWYRIQPGDTLGGIASRFGYTIADLMYWSPKTLQNPNMIFAGDAIILKKKP